MPAVARDVFTPVPLEFTGSETVTMLPSSRIDDDVRLVVVAVDVPEYFGRYWPGPAGTPDAGVFQYADDSPIIKTFPVPGSDPISPGSDASVVQRILVLVLADVAVDDPDTKTFSGSGPAEARPETASDLRALVAVPAEPGPALTSGGTESDREVVVALASQCQLVVVPVLTDVSLPATGI